MSAAAHTLPVKPKSAPVASKPPTPVEIRNETAAALAADLIERGLQSRFDDLYLTLLQIADAELIDKDSPSAGFLNRLCTAGEPLTDRLVNAFRATRTGGAFHLLKKCTSLAEEVDLYRQEQFWLGKTEATFLESEGAIRALYKFYSDAEFLLLQIDAAQPDYRVENRRKAPVRSPNPYETIDHD